MTDSKSTRFPGYDVMRKRGTPSFNAKTREVLDKRLGISDEHRQFFSPDEFETVRALAGRIVPQPDAEPGIPVAALVDRRLHLDRSDGYRTGDMPKQRDAWRQGLAALDAEMRNTYDRPFRDLDPSTQDLVLKKMQHGELTGPAWRPMTAKQFFKERIGHDIVMAYYGHPTAWNEIGFGGPASPRGYVRMNVNDRDPWEAAEIKDGDIDTATRKNLRVDR